MDELTRRFLKNFMMKLVPNEKNSDKKDQIESVSETMLDIFVDATIYYLKCIAKQANKVAEHSGRTQVHAGDIFDALWNYHENVESLCNFIIDFQKIDTIQVGAYPIVSPESNTPNDYPYRADALVEFSGENNGWHPPHVPQFLPTMADSQFDDLTENAPEFADTEIEIAQDLSPANIGFVCPLVESIVKNCMAPVEKTPEPENAETAI